MMSIINKKISKTSNKIKRRGLSRLLFIVMFVVFFLYSMSLLYPIIWGIINSLKVNKEFILGKWYSLPKQLMLINYVTAFEKLEVKNTSLFGMIFNSVWITFTGTIIRVFISCVMAYVTCKYKFFGRNIVIK